MARIVLTVTADTTERLDRFLADQLDLSRTQAARLVAAGGVQVGEATARASRLLARGDEVVVTFPDHEPPRTLTPNPLPLVVIHEDDELMVLDKPAGLVVHPAPGHWDDTLVNALVARGTTLSGGAAGRPGIVHRLDRDTSGLMVVAKTDLAHRRLSAAIAARRVSRVYAALAWGHLAEPSMLIDAPVGRHLRDRKRMAILPEGRAARTEATVLARFESVELLRLVLQTGRTHQIRVHLESVGHPIVGDAVYHGGGSRRISGAARHGADQLARLAPRQALHAAELGFRHPGTGLPVVFRSEWPQDLRPLLVAASAGTISVAEEHQLQYLRFFGDHDD
ncbi:MAG: RluA family pseudouridine synthase [Gemmatimonadota bacterium]|nr:RluA family pseudouridine synthase [Gemmatimonadota bacterium]